MTNKIKTNSINTKLKKHKLNLRQKTILIIVLTIIFILAIFINSLLIDPSSITTNFNAVNQPPSFQHLFGTDWMGRDMFTRTMKGLGLSIQIGVIAAIIGAVIGVILALTSSINKYLDSFVSWLIDLFSSIPHILLVILISISLGGGALGVIMGVAITHWVSLSRVLRAEIKQIKTQEFIKLSSKFGKSRIWIAIHHILPLIITQIIIGTMLIFPQAIMHEASITFLGFGLSPHEPSIGVILSESMNYISTGAWWLAFFPGLALLIIILVFDLIGDNIQRILDPTNAHDE